MEKIYQMMSSGDNEIRILSIPLFLNMPVLERRLFVSKYFGVGQIMKEEYFMVRSISKVPGKTYNKIAFYKDGYVMYLYNNDLVYYHKESFQRWIEVSHNWEKIYL